MPEQSIEPTIECSKCGRNGIPPVECDECHGKAPVQARQFTLSEERAGRAPKPDRESPYGVGPRIVTTLPGSGGQGGTPPSSTN